MLLFAGLVVVGFPAAAGATTASDATFSFPKNRTTNIVLVPAKIDVASLGASGVATPNPDWTSEARSHFVLAIKQFAATRSMEVGALEPATDEQEAYLAEYTNLFSTVSLAALYHTTYSRLPTKKQRSGYRFDWTLGPGAARLGEMGGGQYALFVKSYDAYATDGRKALQVFGVLLGAGFPTGGEHYALAGLVELKTGNIVWMNLLPYNVGDIRTREGSQVRADKLLSTMPLREGEKPAKAVRK